MSSHADVEDHDRLPDFFPLIDKKKKCKQVALSFFECFEEHGKQEPGTRDESAGFAVFTKCKKELEAYSSCMKRVAGDKNLRLVRAPDAYLEQLGRQLDNKDEA
mmetsp:Transcript_6954/g.12392  ORF Transcript_6954/g.12392 Transcript_6954/m.12392 type:complete len:104 (+) Transcript_6954:218-529(+)